MFIFILLYCILYMYMDSLSEINLFIYLLNLSYHMERSKYAIYIYICVCTKSTLYPYISYKCLWERTELLLESQQAGVASQKTKTFLCQWYHKETNLSLLSVTTFAHTLIPPASKPFHHIYVDYSSNT